MPTLPKSRLYWLLQSIGWLLYGTVNFASLATFNYASTSVAKIAIISILGAAQLLLLTHFFRLFIKRKNWFRFSYAKLIPILLASTVALAAFSQITISVVAVWILKIFELRDYSLFYLGVNIFQVEIWVILWTLLYLSIHFFRNYKAEEIEKWRLQATLKDAELIALKAQINPHFIFNCLNNIRALVLEDADKAREAITQLSDLLRSSILFNKAETVTLAEELAIVRDYLALESIHMESRLQYSITVSPEVEDCLVPPMAIQLLAENAIKHSLSLRPEGGELSVRAYRDSSSDAVCIQVLNTGQLSEQTQPSAKGTGTGLQNLRDRLSLLFGPDARLTLANQGPTQVAATINIPAASLQETTLQS